MPPLPGTDDSSLEAVRFSVLTNALLLVVFLGTFEIFLRREGTRQLLAPKLPSPERIGFLCSRFPSFLSGGFVAWARKVWEQRHQPVDLEPDATILIRFCQLGLKFSLLGTAFSCVLLPMQLGTPSWSHMSTPFHLIPPHREQLGVTPRSQFPGTILLTGAFPVFMRATGIL